jgi:hypothetical protein
MHSRQDVSLSLDMTEKVEIIGQQKLIVSPTKGLSF